MLWGPERIFFLNLRMVQACRTHLRLKSTMNVECVGNKGKYTSNNSFAFIAGDVCCHTLSREQSNVFDLFEIYWNPDPSVSIILRRSFRADQDLSNWLPKCCSFLQFCSR